MDRNDWDLNVDVRTALQLWHHKHHAEAAPTDRVFAEAGVPLNSYAAT